MAARRVTDGSEIGLMTPFRCVAAPRKLCLGAAPAAALFTSTGRLPPSRGSRARHCARRVGGSGAAGAGLQGSSCVCTVATAAGVRFRVWCLFSAASVSTVHRWRTVNYGAVTDAVHGWRRAWRLQIFVLRTGGAPATTPAMATPLRLGTSGGGGACDGEAAGSPPPLRASGGGLAGCQGCLAGCPSGPGLKLKPAGTCSRRRGSAMARGGSVCGTCACGVSPRHGPSCDAGRGSAAGARRWKETA